MKKEILHKELLAKKEKLEAIGCELKKTFIGLDSVIDEMMNLVSAWHLFSFTQLRPTVINLWGMTGSGKTALIQKLVELLDHKKLYVQLDMGEFESDSASWIKSTLTDDLEFFHQQSGIICLDEFQFAKTIDNERELGKDKLRVIWDLLDSGKINYIPSGNTYHLRRAETCAMALLKAESYGVEIENGVVIKNEQEFLEVFKGFYFEDSGRNGVALDKDYFISKDFLQGIFYLYDDENATREILDEKTKAADLRGLIDIIIDGVKTRTGVKTLDLSRSLIFVLGNLDEAYYMSNSLNPDISADELHEATSKINISHIKAALKKRFRNEQIARLGNNHIIYKSFTTAHFRELIRREMQRINNFVKDNFDFSISFHASVHDIVYREGVFPAQGTRPVLTTVKNLIEGWISKITIEALEKNMNVTVVEWSYSDDKYVFVFKDSMNNVLNIYEEKINLKIDSLRKIANRDVQAHIAVHESGHAILAALTFRILPSVVVSKTAADNCEGFCMINFPQGIMTRETLKKDIIVSLGGFVAEKMIFGEEHTSAGVYSDLESASELANKAVKYYGMGKDPVHIQVKSFQMNEYFFSNDGHSNEALQILKECQDEAEELLERNKFLLLKMAEFLTDHNKMEEAQIGDMVKQYSVENWIGDNCFVKKEDYFGFENIVKKQLKEMSLRVK
ncbi:MAG: hypothetical protein K0S32_2097 [Bacteroidetes bacterium]|jgi:cell division protease FtsH|nr:hypothetical protein [Bacteroidota bacterium]